MKPVGDPRGTINYPIGTLLSINIAINKVFVINLFPDHHYPKPYKKNY